MNNMNVRLNPHPPLRFFRWTLSLGARFCRVVPIHTILIGSFSILSQLSMLLASFLPLKVVILLGSDGMPRYFPPTLAQFDRDSLILGLSAATLGFFILHRLTERMIEHVTRKATVRLLAKTQKIPLFKNVDEIAATGYQRYSRALAGGAFALLASLALSFFYPSIVGVMLGYSLIALFVTSILYKCNAAFREQMDTKPGPVLKLISDIGFLTTFSYLLADFILWQPPGFIVAIVSLLACRQIMRVGTIAIADVIALYRQRPKLDALFFQNKVLLPKELRMGKVLWPLLRPQHRENWLHPMLTELLGYAPGKLETSWHQSDIPNVVILHVSDDNSAWLVKLFGHNRTTLAVRESTLMSESLKRLPALPWVGVTVVGEFHCLVYALPTGGAPTRRQARDLITPLRTQLLAAPPSAPLKQRFRRSWPVIWQRLGQMPWDRLFSVANTPQQRTQIEMFVDALPSLQQRLKSLPLTIINPDMQVDAIWLDEDGQAMLTNWGHWSLEPLGASWPVTLESLPMLALAIEDASRRSPRLATVSSLDAELAALAFALEKECIRQRFSQAFELIPLVLERLSEGRKIETQLKI